MAQNDSRGVAVPVAILLAVASAAMGLSAKAGLPLGNPWAWFAGSIICVVAAVLLWATHRWWPRSDATPKDGARRTTITRSPDVNIVDNRPDSGLRDVEIVDSPNVNVELNEPQDEAPDSDDEAAKE